MKKFCDFCSCKMCKDGWKGVHIDHAKTEDGRYICEVCWEYWYCKQCERTVCSHKPRLIEQFHR